MALPNLTREQAVERAALVTVDNYRIVLDLTDGEGHPSESTFRSTTTVEFDALPGADTVIDLAAERIRSANSSKLSYGRCEVSSPICASHLARRRCVGSCRPPGGPKPSTLTKRATRSGRRPAYSAATCAPML